MNGGVLSMVIATLGRICCCDGGMEMNGGTVYERRMIMREVGSMFWLELIMERRRRHVA